MKHLLILLSILLLSSPFSGVSAQTRGISRVVLQIPNGERIQLYSQSHALVIGVSKYQDSAWGQLDSVPMDVREVKKALEGQGFNVETILNPTKQDMNDRIEQFIGDYGFEKNNRLLFYYSGHGYTQERNGRQFGYLVPSDAPNPLTDEKGFFRKSLKMTRILSWAKEIESKHALFVFDSCFSGSVLRSRALSVPEDISYSTSKPVRQFISAGSADQPVPAESVFRPLFIRGINGKADLDGDGYVTGVELGMYLQKEVPTYESGQTPQYGKIRDPYLDEGNFVFQIPFKKIIPTPQNTDSRNNWVKEKKVYVWGYDGLYTGETENGIPNGQGRFVFKDSTYSKDGELKGHFQDGKLNGQGEGIYPNGDSYSGGHKDNYRHGFGTYTNPDGDKYVGEFKDGKRNGQGTFTYPNGDKYVGEFKDDKRNGQGTFTYPDGDKYVGEYKDDKQNGQGTYTFANGDKYVGEYKDDKRNGQGTYTYGKGKWEGDKYVGEFKDGKYNGQGTFTSGKGKFEGERFVGEWKDDKSWNGREFDKYGNILFKYVNGVLQK